MLGFISQSSAVFGSSSLFEDLKLLTLDFIFAISGGVFDFTSGSAIYDTQDDSRTLLQDRIVAWGSNSRNFLQRQYLLGLPIRAQDSKATAIAPDDGAEAAKPDHISSSLKNYLIDLVDANMDDYYLGRATFTSEETALYARTRGYDQTSYHGQVCHVYPECATVHLELHPEDLHTIVEAGWGKYQQQTASERLFNFLYQSPATHGIVHGPRNEEELEIVKDIISAAAWWVKGVDSRDSKESWT